MKLPIAVAALFLRSASALRPRRLQDSMSMPADPVPPPPPSGDTCSCSPREFTFQLQLDRDCDTNTISGSPGISDAACNVRGGAGDVNMTTLEIESIQFLEFGYGNVTVIDQTLTPYNPGLTTGDTFLQPSVSINLVPGVSIDEQLQYLPTGASLIIMGKAKDAGGNNVTVTNQVAWTYTNSCEDLPIQVGQAIGWVDVVANTDGPSPYFCPAAGPIPPPTLPTTTTEATTTTAATTTPAATTTAATTTASATTTAPPLFGKGGKSTKSAKQKTPKDPMAKFAKSTEDAKAKKVSKSSKGVSKSAKSKSSKGGKMFKSKAGSMSV